MEKDMLNITEIPAFNDNYIWVLREPESSFAYVVDPGQAKPVLAYLAQHNLTLAGILITHKHKDHIGGIKELQAHYHGKLAVYGPKAENISGVTHEITSQSTLDLPHINTNVTIISVPGHTLGHISYLIYDAIFCGDTLFSAGCGRLFEGSPAQMLESLNKLASLPASCKCYCAHEYTQANLKFALHVIPDNPQLVEYASWVTKARANNIPTVPCDLSTELAINPFLRCHTNEVKQAIIEKFGILEAPKLQDELISELQTFTLLRQWKDTF
jgi:hydroxyacylglutathione hydrolase